MWLIRAIDVDLKAHTHSATRSLDGKRHTAKTNGCCVPKSNPGCNAVAFFYGSGTALGFSSAGQMVIIARGGHDLDSAGHEIPSQCSTGCVT